MSLTSDRTAAAITAVFEAEGIPAEQDVLAADATSLDALEMRAALVGKHWSAVAMRELSYHRESVAELGPVGLKAYIAAFLLAALQDDHRAPDIYQYTLFALCPLNADDQERTRQRLALLEPPQRAAIIEWLRYFASHDAGAQRALDYWT